MKSTLLLILLVLNYNLFAQTPTVENVRFEQRTDGSLLVDIYYDVTTVSDLPLEILVEASGDKGATWDLTCNSLSGDVGEDITAGTNKHIIWDFYNDNPNTSGSNYQVQVTAHCMVCGQVITENLTLTRDIFCHDNTLPGVYIGVSDITFDLGGYTMRGDMLNEGYIEAIQVDKTHNVTVRNGSIIGFGGGVMMGGSHNCSIENLYIENLDIDDPALGLNGIGLGECHDIYIRFCRIKYLPNIPHHYGINSACSNFYADSIEVYGGGACVTLSGVQYSGLPGTTGSVTNSRFYNNFDGILATYCDSFRIVGNYFEDSGFTTDPISEGDVHWVTIDRNEFYDGSHAIFFKGGNSSVITNNIVRNTLSGIFLDDSQGCDPGSIKECFYCTGMLISNNIALGNEIDLHHEENCTGNTWIDNIYETAIGEEIYTYGSTSAGKFFTRVDSTAKDTVPDAELLLISSMECDSSGESIKWIYIYESESQQENYEFWVNDGNVATRESVSIPWLIREEYQPISKSWIDSDSAIVIANSQGGTEFIKTTEFRKIDMNLFQDPEGMLFWEIIYLAQDSMWGSNINAILE